METETERRCHDTLHKSNPFTDMRLKSKKHKNGIKD